jgi:hypothetical protein
VWGIREGDDFTRSRRNFPDLSRHKPWNIVNETPVLSREVWEKTAFGLFLISTGDLCRQEHFREKRHTLSLFERQVGTKAR